MGALEMNFNSRNTPLSSLNLTKQGHLFILPFHICLMLPFKWQRTNISCQRAFRQRLPSVLKQIGTGIHAKRAGVGILQARLNSPVYTLFSHYSSSEISLICFFLQGSSYIFPPSQWKVSNQVTGKDPKEMAILLQRNANGQSTQNVKPH